MPKSETHTSRKLWPPRRHLPTRKYLSDLFNQKRKIENLPYLLSPSILSTQAPTWNLVAFDSNKYGSKIVEINEAYINDVILCCFAVFQGKHPNERHHTGNVTAVSLAIASDGQLTHVCNIAYLINQTAYDRNERLVGDKFHSIPHRWPTLHVPDAQHRATHWCLECGPSHVK